MPRNDFINTDGTINYDNIPSTSQVANISIKQYGAKGDNTTDDYLAFNRLISSIGSSNVEVYLPSGTYIIGTNITIPSNISLVFANGAMLSPNTSITITINGYIDAPVSQIFSGVGTIAGTFKTKEVIPQWFGAKGDGITDDTIAFKNALSAVASTMGTVFVPPSAYGYLIAGDSINIPSGVTLYGNNSGYKIGTLVNPLTGSILLIVGNSGNAVGNPVFIMHSGSGFKGISVKHPNQTATNPPIAYPYLIKGVDSDCNDVIIKDVFLYNCFQFADFTGNHQRVTFKDISGDILNTGIVIDYGWDVDFLDNIHFWPYYSQTNALGTYRANNAIGITLGQSDGIQGSNIFIYGLKRGFILGNSNRAPYGQLNNVSLDICAIGIETVNVGRQGFLINELDYAMSPILQSTYGITTTYALLINHSVGLLQIDNFNIWGGPNKFLFVNTLFGVSSQLKINNINIFDNADTQLFEHKGTGELILSNMRSKINNPIYTATASSSPIIENPDLVNESWVGSIIPIFKRYKVETTVSVVSIDNFVIPLNARNIIVTGSTNINWITPVLSSGTEITLIFTGTLIVGNSGTTNIRLASQFNATADSTLTLISNGTNWLEKCRSVNI